MADSKLHDSPSESRSLSLTAEEMKRLWNMGDDLDCAITELNGCLELLIDYAELKSATEPVESRGFYHLAYMVKREITAVDEHARKLFDHITEYRRQIAQSDD